jgi:hypothetical protein
MPVRRDGEVLDVLHCSPKIVCVLSEGSERSSLSFSIGPKLGRKTVPGTVVRYQEPFHGCPLQIGRMITAELYEGLANRARAP